MTDLFEKSIQTLELPKVLEKLADQVQRDIDATIRYFENEAGN